MKRHKIVTGYEPSASGSEDESGFSKANCSQTGLSSSVYKITTSNVKQSAPYLSSYSIKPIIERSDFRKPTRLDKTIGSESKAVKEFESDEDQNDVHTETTRYRGRKRRAKQLLGKRSEYMTKKSSKVVNGLHSHYFNTVFVVDYDMTLVDQNGRPFMGAKKFLRKLYDFNDGKSTMVSYSHATSSHIEHGLSNYFVEEADYFKEKITDHTMSTNKPVTQVRRVLSNIKDLSGPFVIIDDVRSNLDDDQYDITVDVSRHFIRDKSTNKIIGVDYNTILCL